LFEGFFYALFDFFVTATITYVLYLLAIYVIESIVLYDFDYNDEISKKKNIAYAIISFAHSLGLAFLIQTSVKVSTDATRHVIVFIVFLWLIMAVMLGFATKTYRLVSKLKFSPLLSEKNLAVGFSYMGFFWGWVIIMANALNLPMNDLKSYWVGVILKILLGLIILPIFKEALKFIFHIQGELEEGDRGVSYGYGIYEGALFITSAFLTTVITGNISLPF
jgi:uncharacterized membrane protein YjfL (UPF0719 family)